MTKSKLQKLSLVCLIIGLVVMAIAYFFFHFVTDEGITLVWHHEAGKMILIALYSSVGLLIPVVVVLSFMGVSSPLEITMTGLFSLCSIATGFYYWKAKCENLHKYKQDDKIGNYDDMAR